MFLPNKERRVKYLGFNDVWFSIVGIIALSFIVDYLISNSFGSYPFPDSLINYSVSLFFSICNWLIIRPVVILLRKRYPELKDDAIRIVLLFLSVQGIVLVIYLVGNYAIAHLLSAEFNPLYDLSIPVIVSIVSFMVTALYEAVYYQIRLKKSVRREEQAKQVMIQAQLDTLKNQAQPHFLFNTLNTLRDIIDQNEKEDAKKFVDKLSDIYRFILDSGKVNTTSLRKEIKFAKAYMHIQSERFGDNLIVNWQIPEDMMDHMIIPMSLQLLLENAIKHNVVSRSKPLVIDIVIDNNNLIVTNKIQVKSTKLHSTKMGLKNIDKRYNLIADKSITILKDQHQFSVAIPLLNMSDKKNAYEGTDH